MVSETLCLMRGYICSQITYIQGNNGGNTTKATKHSNVNLLTKAKEVIKAI